MGYYNASTEENDIYTAYGYTVSGKETIFEWSIYGGKTEKCFLYIVIKDAEGKEVYNKYMGNNVIFNNVLERHIDNILYYLSKNKISTTARKHTKNRRSKKQYRRGTTITI